MNRCSQSGTLQLVKFSTSDKEGELNIPNGRMCSFWRGQGVLLARHTGRIFESIPGNHFVNCETIFYVRTVHVCQNPIGLTKRVDFLPPLLSTTETTEKICRMSSVGTNTTDICFVNFENRFVFTLPSLYRGETTPEQKRVYAN